eukprot:GHRR01001013.1.p1 GENE.GHRR01001013.1~~GHRR01001013.1.p1  ORF type:complete len:385 (+),score=83.84 GHRR01001013.1:3271-4425(+)
MHSRDPDNRCKTPSSLSELPLAGAANVKIAATNDMHASTLHTQADAAVTATESDRSADWDVWPHPALAAGAPHRAQFDAPATAPVCITCNPIAGTQEVDGSSQLNKPLPINTDYPVPIKGPLGQGKMCLHVRGLESTKQHVFAGKKRYMHVAIQGTIDRDIRASDYWTGQEWFTMSDLLPTSLLNVILTAVAKMFSSTTRVSSTTANGEMCGFLNPVLASCQLVNVSLPGQEPDIMEAHEDARLLHPDLADKNGQPLSSDKRRHWFDHPANAAQVVLSKDYVYTWHLWQHWCNFATYGLQLTKRLSLDLRPLCEGQPMQIMAKDQSTGEYLINYLIWHKSLLYKDEDSNSTTASMKVKLGSLKLSSLKSGWKSLTTGTSSKRII